MKKRFLLFCFITLCAYAGFAANADTVVAYKIGKYDIKKTEKVYVVADKLHVDPQLIVQLNKLRNIQQDLVPGQRIKIPVYPKGYKYEQQRIVVHKELNADSAQLALLYADVEKNMLAPLPEKFFDPEEERTRLMIVEAQLELNEAMMQGVQASFDSLNVQDTTKIDEKNVQAMLRRMKRSREKALLTPYLENVRDSLSKEIVKLSEERKVIEARVNPPAPPTITRDTVISATDTIVYATKIYSDNRPAETSVASVMIKEEPVVIPAKIANTKKYEKKARQAKRYYAIDTVIIYDLPSTTAKLKPAPEKNPIKQPEVVKGIWDTARAIEPLQSQKPLWDTARAIGAMKDTLKTSAKITDVKKDTTIALKIKVPGSINDSIVIKPVIKKQEPKPEPVLPAGTETATSNTEQNVSAAKDTAAAKPIAKVEVVTIDTVLAQVKTDSVKTEVVLAPVIKADTVKPLEIKQTAPVKKQSVGDALIASADSVKRIKAEFFYRRYQKAMSDKNFRNAQGYLHKAIELSPKYFEAWYALAEMEAMFGSQQAALKSYIVCKDIDSTRPKLYLSMGNLQIKMKRKTDAFASYNRALELSPNDISALMARATILVDWKKYRDAIIDYDRVVQISRATHYAYKARGQAKFLNKDYAAAIDDFTRFIIFEESDPSAYYYRGLAKISNNELVDGCMDLSNAADMGYPAAARAIKKSCE